MNVLTQEDYLQNQRIQIQPITAVPFGAHSHDFLEIAYISKGSAVNILGDQKVQLSAGTYIIIDYYTVHQIIEKSSDIEGFNCLFIPNLIDPSLSNCKSFKSMLTTLIVPCFNQNSFFFFQDKDGQILDLLLHIQKELEEKQLGYQEAAKTYLTQILLFSMRNFQQNNKENSVQNPLLGNIIQFLQKNYAQKDLLRLASKKFSYSTSYISILFQKNLGIHFNEYVRQLRIRIACQLLTHSNHSIEEISFAVGYHNVHSFRSNFKEQMSLTPMQYRKKARIS